MIISHFDGLNPAWNANYVVPSLCWTRSQSWGRRLIYLL